MYQAEKRHGLEARKRISKAVKDQCTWSHEHFAHFRSLQSTFDLYSPCQSCFYLTSLQFPIWSGFLFVWLVGQFAHFLWCQALSSFSFQPPWQVLSSTDSLTHKPLVNFLTLPHTHFPFLGQRVCFKMQIWSCQSSYLKLFNSTFFPVWVF